MSVSKSRISAFLEDLRLIINRYQEMGESRANLVNHLEGYAKQVRQYPNMLEDDPLKRLVV